MLDLSMKVRVWVIALSIVPLSVLPLSAFAAQPAHAPRSMNMIATAYCTRGLTSSGVTAERGIVAADVRLLPLGSRVRIRGEKVHGDYTVQDEGAAVKGHRIDIFIPDCAQAKRFGRQRVTVLLLGK